MEINGYATKKGLILSAKLLTGETLTITRVVAGGGATADPGAAVSLPQPKQTLAVNTPTRSGETAIIPVTLVAAQAEAGYTLRELGVYAKDPDEGEILYKIYKLKEPVDISPASRLVLRFYLEETVSQDLNVTVVCSPAGLITEDVFGPVRDKAYGVKQPAETYRVNASELQAKINSLPRCLTQDVTIIVTGTENKHIAANNFYGNGQLRIQGSEKDTFVMTAGISFYNCNCKIILANATLQADGTWSGQDLLEFDHCSDAEVINIEINGGSYGKRGISASISNVLLNSASIRNCKWAILLCYGSRMAIRKADNYAAASYSNNEVGIYIYHGGIAYLSSDIPNLLGAAAHNHNTGLIVSSSGTLL